MLWDSGNPQPETDQHRAREGSGIVLVNVSTGLQVYVSSAYHHGL